VPAGARLQARDAEPRVFLVAHAAEALVADRQAAAGQAQPAAFALARLRHDRQCLAVEERRVCSRMSSYFCSDDCAMIAQCSVNRKACSPPGWHGFDATDTALTISAG
jgi:hypothetical protein